MEWTGGCERGRARCLALGWPDRPRDRDHARDGGEHDDGGPVRGRDPADPARPRPRSRPGSLDLPHDRHRWGRFRLISGLRGAAVADADLTGPPRTGPPPDLSRPAAPDGARR